MQLTELAQKLLEACNRGQLYRPAAEALFEILDDADKYAKQQGGPEGGEKVELAAGLLGDLVEYGCPGPGEAIGDPFTVPQV